jgi:hypothetical protein
MRRRTILASAAVFFVGLGLCFADDPQMGSWKLNEGKSKVNPEGPKNTSVVYAAAGDSVKVTVDGVDKDGRPSHNEWTGKFDGKEYAVTGDPTSDMRSYKKIDDRTMEVTATKGGKVTLAGRIVVAPDGKSRTLSVTGTDAGGKKVTSTLVYDKQ